MAGSYNHVKRGWSMIENMGDAEEAVEEMFFIINAYLDESEIKDAVRQLARYKNGLDDPRKLIGGGPDSSSDASMSDFGKAYLKMKKVMNK